MAQERVVSESDRAQELLPAELRGRWIALPRWTLHQLVLGAMLLGAGIALTAAGLVLKVGWLEFAFPLAMFLMWLQNVAIPWPVRRTYEDLAARPSETGAGPVGEVRLPMSERVGSSTFAAGSGLASILGSLASWSSSWVLALAFVAIATGMKTSVKARAGGRWNFAAIASIVGVLLGIGGLLVLSRR